MFLLYLTRDAMFHELRNIFTDIPADLSEELIQTLCARENVRIERIISDGHFTPESAWYDQAADEWVLLLAGSAGIIFEGDLEELNLEPGDYLMIPAGCRHRVTRTDPAQKTFWLAIHFG